MSMVKVDLPQAIKLSDHLNKVLTGYYLGSRKVDTKTETGESILHIFKEKDGTEIEVWSFDLLKRLLSRVPVGCLTQMKYTGKMKYNDKEIHQVEVYFDVKDKIAVDEG